MKRLTTLGMVLALWSGTAGAAETVSYTFVNDQIGTPGSQIVERSDDGLFTVKFVYKNNGRGPELIERFRLAPDGTFGEYHVTGTSEFGAIVDEHFERKGDVAEWHSTSEHGKATTSSPALYVPLNSSYAPVASPFSSSYGISISTLDEAKQAVDWYAQRGYPQLKIYNSFPKEILRETVAYAHRRGMRVSGHVPAFMRAAEVVEQGFDEIQHINQVLLNFLVTADTDTRTLERFRLPAEQVADMDFDSRPVQDFIAMLASRQTVIDPTLATFDDIQQKDGEMSAPYAAVADHLPPDVRRGLFVGSMKIADAATHARYKRSYAKMVDFVGRLYRAGVPLVAGTDATPGFTLQAELALYVQAGLTPAQALQIATRNGARYTGTSRDRGSVSPGKLADLVLLDGEPTKDIGDLRKVALVVTQGQWLSPKDMYEEMGILPFVQTEPAVRSTGRRLTAEARN